jgi:hypothetical protein
MKMQPAHLALIAVIAITFTHCNNSSGTASSTDSGGSIKPADSSSVTAEATIDTIHDKIDSSKTIIIPTIDLGDIDCDSVAALLAKRGIRDPAFQNLLDVKNNNCNLAAWNKVRTDSPKVTIVTQDISNGNTRLLFNTMDAKTADQIAKVSKNIVTLVAAMESDGNFEVTTVATIAGNYTVDAYVQAAKKNDPLIFIYPAAIPAKRLTVDTYNTLLKGKTFVPAEYVVNGVVSAGTDIVDVGKGTAKTAVKGATIIVTAPLKIIKAIVPKVHIKL